MRWFGKPGGAPYESDAPHTDVPVGQPCAWCNEPFTADDDGVLIPLHSAGAITELAYHYECHLRKIIGGLNHLAGRCTCCGGTEPPDPPWLTPRQAAIAAVAAWRQDHE